MNAIVTYTKLRDTVRVLGVYTDGHSMERRMDFRAVPRKKNLLDVQSFLESNPLAFCEFSVVDIPTDLDDVSFSTVFSEKLLRSVRDFGDEKTLVALTMRTSVGGG